MKLISTWRRRFGLAALVMLIASFGVAVLMFSGESAHRSWSVKEVIFQLFVFPALLATAVLCFSTAAATPTRMDAAKAAESESPSPATSQPFAAQVVGVEWLNPLQRRDYPTEWQLLWTLGLVKPNANDDMVRTDPEGFTSIKPVAGIADGRRGRATFEEFHHKYVRELLQVFGDRYAMNQKYFYTVASTWKHNWRELAGIHIEYALPAGRLDAVAEAKYLQQQIISDFAIGNPHFPDLWSKDTPPSVNVTLGGANAGFVSLNAALDYLKSHPKESVWVMNWDAPSFPPEHAQMNENMTLLILAGPQMKTERDPLAWISRVATANVDDFEPKVGTSRKVQAWKAAIDAAALNANIKSSDISYVIHDVGQGSDVVSERIGALAQTLTETLPDFDFQNQTFNMPALLGETGAGTALTDIALAIGRANHLGGHVLVAGTTDPTQLSAVIVTPPAQLIPIDAERNWFRARGEGDAYLPWWGRRRDVSYTRQGFTY
ncbi:virulence factor [Trinickia sp. Y13]|uniref:virulence factor n=1 Tax=Trinickia sp. Y13 TaxID=2917807 RepID=UPI002405BE4C|nr:virulence factor [Trinickia sp. Y13]MDG0024525.1 virulence factor [Trinickia sp. Y13]